MSALGDVAAALLPPEAGGPDPERVAGLALGGWFRGCRLSWQVGLGAALVGIEAFSLRPHPPHAGGAPRLKQREELLVERLRRLGGAGALLDAFKSIVLLAHGTDAYAVRDRRGRLAAAIRHDRSDDAEPDTSGGVAGDEPKSAT